MRVIDLDNINLAMRNEEQFVLRCEEVFHDKISSAAARTRRKKTPRAATRNSKKKPRSSAV